MRTCFRWDVERLSRVVFGWAARTTLESRFAVVAILSFWTGGASGQEEFPTNWPQAAGLHPLLPGAMRGDGVAGLKKQILSSNAGGRATDPFGIRQMLDDRGELRSNFGE